MQAESAELHRQAKAQQDELKWPDSKVKKYLNGFEGNIMGALRGGER